MLIHGVLEGLEEGGLRGWLRVTWLFFVKPSDKKFFWGQELDVGQNGRPLMGPQMWKSSLVLTIHNFGVPNFDPYPIGENDDLKARKRKECRWVCLEMLG